MAILCLHLYEHLLGEKNFSIFIIVQLVCTFMNSNVYIVIQCMYVIHTLLHFVFFCLL